MRVSELSAATGVAVGTIKFYLREKVLHPGTLTSRTSADYDDTHVERIRLVRALTDVGGLGVAQVRSVIAVIDAPEPPRLDVLGVAQHALVSSTAPVVASAPAASVGAARERASDVDVDADADVGIVDGSASGAEPTPRVRASRARDWVLARGWFAPQEDLLIPLLERAWSACEEAGVDLDEERLDAYATAMEQVAAVDVGAVPPGVDWAVRRVVVGTVMIEPVLAALRLLAQREAAISIERAGLPGG